LEIHLAVTTAKTNEKAKDAQRFTENILKKRLHLGYFREQGVYQTNLKVR
jgi:hypothetical protein